MSSVLDFWSFRNQQVHVQIVDIYLGVNNADMKLWKRKGTHDYKIQAEKEFPGQNIEEYLHVQDREKKNFKKFLRKEEKSNIRKSSVEIYEKATELFFNVSGTFSCIYKTQQSLKNIGFQYMPIVFNPWGKKLNETCRI